MTLVLSVITSTVALQVSDRRVTREEGGRLVWQDDHHNKATIYDFRACIAYTGVSEIAGTRTDTWIAKILAESSHLGDGLPKLRDRATDSFSRKPLKGQPLGIVIVGWRYKPPDGTVSGFYSVISNFFLNGTWISTPQDRFLWAVDDAPTGHFNLFHAGHNLSRSHRVRVRRNLRRAMDRNVHVREGIRLLVDEIRRVAEIDDRVGRSLIVSCIPRRAVETMKGEGWLVTGEPLPNIGTFAYVPAESDERISYGPNVVWPGVATTDFASFPRRRIHDPATTQPHPRDSDSSTGR